MATMDGRKVSSEVLQKLYHEVNRMKLDHIHPKLAVILVGRDPASLSYIKQKQKSCDVTGIEWEQFDFEEDITTDELIDKIHELNDDENIHQLSTSVISYLLSHNSENLKNKKIISSIIKILNTAKINSNDWSNDTKSQLKISNRGTNPLTGNPLTLFMESAPKLVHLMVCSRIFSQKF